MKRSVCHSCEMRQQGDLNKACERCNGKLQTQVLCPWCVSWSPDNKKCVRCDLDLTFQEDYIVMRALAVAGVDKMSLSTRAEALTAEEKISHGKIFDEQLKMIVEKAEVFGYLEKCLIGQDYRLRYIDSCVSSLPLTRDQASRYSAIPIPKLTGNREAVLRKIRECALDNYLEPLANIALFRTWIIEKGVTDSWLSLWHHPTYEKEALALLGHPLTAECSFPVRGEESQSEFTSKLKALLANPLFANWAALAFFRSGRGYGKQVISEENWEKMVTSATKLVEAGAKAKDPELSFACALALGDVDKLLPYAKRKGDGFQKEMALDVISVSGERRTFPFFQKNPRKVSLISRQGRELAPALLRFVLDSYKKTDEESRRAVQQIRHFGSYLEFSRTNRQIIKKWFQGKASAALSIEDRMAIFKWIASEKKNPDYAIFHESISRYLLKVKASELPKVFSVEGIDSWIQRAKSKSDLKLLLSWTLSRSPEISKGVMNLFTRLPDKPTEWTPPGGWTSPTFFEALLKAARPSEKTELTLRWLRDWPGYIGDELLSVLAKVYIARVEDRDHLYKALFEYRTRIKNTWKGFEDGIPPGADIARSLKLWIQIEKYHVENHVVRAWKAAPTGKIKSFAKLLPQVLLDKNIAMQDPLSTSVRAFEEIVRALKGESTQVFKQVDEGWIHMKKELQKLVKNDYMQDSLKRVDDALCEVLPHRKVAREKDERRHEEERNLAAKIKSASQVQVEMAWTRYRAVIAKLQKALTDSGTELQREHTKIVTSDLPPEKRTSLAMQLSDKYMAAIKKRSDALSRSGDEVTAIVKLFEAELTQMISTGLPVKELLKKSHAHFAGLKKRLDDWETKLMKKAG